MYFKPGATTPRVGNVLGLGFEGWRGTTLRIDSIDWSIDITLILSFALIFLPSCPGVLQPLAALSAEDIIAKSSAEKESRPRQEHNTSLQRSKFHIVSASRHVNYFDIIASRL